MSTAAIDRCVVQPSRGKVFSARPRLRAGCARRPVRPTREAAARGRQGPRAEEEGSRRYPARPSRGTRGGASSPRNPAYGPGYPSSSKIADVEGGGKVRVRRNGAGVVARWPRTVLPQRQRRSRGVAVTTAASSRRTGPSADFHDDQVMDLAERYEEVLHLHQGRPHVAVPRPDHVAQLERVGNADGAGSVDGTSRDPLTRSIFTTRTVSARSTGMTRTSSFAKARSYMAARRSATGGVPTSASPDRTACC